MMISAYGLSVNLPAGWEARVRKLDESGIPAQSTAPGRPARAFTVFPTLHAANFALPEQRGDFGSGAVETMAATEAFIALIEYDPVAIGTPLFANAGMPRQVSPNAFSPRQLQRTLRGQAGWQRFFVENGRAFCVYAVLGGYANRATVVPGLNAVLAGVQVAAP